MHENLNRSFEIDLGIYNDIYIVGIDFESKYLNYNVFEIDFVFG